MAMIERGRESETSFDILEKHEKFSLVRAYPKTGRTHQIRVHLKALGAPILGDPFYGPIPLKESRTMLHAEKLNFTHPFTGEEIEISTPPPLDFQKALKKL